MRRPALLTELLLLLLLLLLLTITTKHVFFSLASRPGIFYRNQRTLLFFFFGLQAVDSLSQPTCIVVSLLWPSGCGFSIAIRTHVSS